MTCEQNNESTATVKLIILLRSSVSSQLVFIVLYSIMTNITVKTFNNHYYYESSIFYAYGASTRRDFLLEYLVAAGIVKTH